MRSIGYKLTRNGTLAFLLAIGCLTGITKAARAQHIGPEQQKTFENREDSLKRFAFDIVNADSAMQRFRADSQFIRSLVRTLKQPYSFYYPFDSLETISRLYAPDSS